MKIVQKFVYIIGLMVFLSLIGLVSASENPNTVPFDNLIEIRTIDDLNLIQNNLYGNYKLMNDLDFGDMNIE